MWWLLASVAWVVEVNLVSIVIAVNHSLVTVLRVSCGSSHFVLLTALLDR